MSKTLNFNTVKKEYLTVTLPDEKNTVLLICTPTKSLMSELTSLKTTFSAETTSDNVEQVLDELYEVVARVMSRNKAGVKITKEKLTECLDFEDIVLFFNSYLTFVKEIQFGKN